jgi:hypothetical protein
MKIECFVVFLIVAVPVCFFYLRSMKTPSSLFVEKGVLLVHCISFAKGVGNGYTASLSPLECLDNVINAQC